MPWFCLIVAGLLEVGWAIGLKESHGFTRLWPSVATVVGLAASMALLGWSARYIPIGTAYPVWVGIGALGTAVLGMVLYREPVTAARMACMVLLVVSIVGLKLTSGGLETD
ncbi:QacE family quaternary ammonium compound efflux SMR transporter [bacterium]|nr:QacE family quaternary ammonium compound efflux SMR transporter [bacterium]